MLLDGIRTDEATPLPDGDAALRALFAVRPGLRDGGASTAPDVAPPTLADPGDAPVIGVVPQAFPRVALPHTRVLAPATAAISTVLHGAVLAAFIAFTAPTLPQTELPSVEIDLVEPEVSPPPAAAEPEPATETPEVRIDPPDMTELPLPPELTSPEQQVAEAPPVDIAPPPQEDMPLPAELQPPEPAEQPQLAAIDPAPVTIEPPPDVDMALPAELTPPPRRQAAVQPPVTRPPPPRREARRPDPAAERRPPPRREVQRQQPQPPRRPSASPAPASAGAQGRGVTTSQTQRTATPPPSYLARVMAQLHRAKPAGSGQQGRATVRFAIIRSGGATGIALASSSGNSAIDQAATAMVRRAAPFPPLPAEFAPAVMSLTVPISFR
jgi:protein TonB